MIEETWPRRSRRRLTRRSGLVAGALVLAIAAVASVGAYYFDGPSLHSLDRGVGVKVPAGRYGPSYTVGDLVLCVDSGSVTVTSVRPIGSHGHMTVAAWGVHDWAGRQSDPPILTGSEGGSLRSVAPWMSHQPIATRCNGHDYPFTELAVQLRFDPDAAPVTSHGFDVTYRNGRRERHVRVDYTFTACPGSTMPSDSCTA